MKRPLRTLSFVLPAAYLLGAAAVWIDFALSPPDGLANVGIALYTLPVVLLMHALTGNDFPFVEGGYYPSHAEYFTLSVLFLAALLYLVIRFIGTLLQRRSGAGTTEASR